MEKKFAIAAKAIVKKDDKYLILHRSDTDPSNPNGLDLPGGKIEFGEHIEDGLRREVLEESNLEIEIVRPLRVWNILHPERHLIGVTYLATYQSGEVVLSYEHSKFEWRTFQEILEGDFPMWIQKDLRNILKNN